MGFTADCRESEGWIDRMGIDMLPHGRHQPFYFVSIDTRFHAAHGIPHYVAQDDIILERTTDVRSVATKQRTSLHSTGTHGPVDALRSCRTSPRLALADPRRVSRHRRGAAHAGHPASRLAALLQNDDACTERTVCLEEILGEPAELILS